MASMWNSLLGRVVLGASAIVVVLVVWFALQVDPIFHGRGREVIVSVAPGEPF